MIRLWVAPGIALELGFWLGLGWLKLGWWKCWDPKM